MLGGHLLTVLLAHNVKISGGNNYDGPSVKDQIKNFLFKKTVFYIFQITPGGV